MLSEKTIGNFFKKAGFKKYEPEDELMLNEEIIEDFVLNENYIDIGKELQTSETLTDNEIIEIVLNTGNDEEEEETVKSGHEKVDVSRSIQIIKRAIYSGSMNDKTKENLLGKVENYIIASLKVKQSKITHF